MNQPVRFSVVSLLRRAIGGAGLLVAVTFAVFMSPSLANAQEFGGAFAGMSDQNTPIEIEADRLEVMDKKGLAVFNGNVSVVQGSTHLKTRKLTVHYAGSGQGGIGANGNIRLIEATGGVAVRSGDQTATANLATVDMQKQLATLSGNVTISQGENVVTGCELIVHLATSDADFRPCKNAGEGGRVKLLVTPKSGSGQ